MGRRRKGFTLLELMIGIVIVSLLILVGMANMRRGVGGAQSQGLAQVVAEELRLARQTALARQVPVAVGFPSANGTVPHSQSVYNLIGQVTPRITRVSNYEGDFPGAVIFSSIWNPSSGSFTTAPPILTTNFDQLPPSWPANPDPLLIFTPSGTVTSNGMARLGEDYHIVVSQGIQYGATGTPPGGSPLAFFQATHVSSAYTITITPLGSVSVTAGVLNSSGVIDDRNGAGPGSAPRAAAPVLAVPANNAPVIDRMTLVSRPPTTPAGTDAMVAPNDQVLLKVEATDLDPDDPLFCKWTAAVPGDGAFSSLQEDRMEWDPTAGTAGTGAWVSYWEWIPTLGSLPPTSFTLNVVVADVENGVVQATDTATRQIAVSTPNEMVFSVDDGGAGNYDLVACNLEGDGFRYLSRTASNETGPVPSPDGARVAYLYQTDSASPDMYYYQRLANGLGARQIAGPIGNLTTNCRPIGWAPDSSEVAVMIYNGSNYDVQIVNLDGTVTAPAELSPDPAVGEYCPTYNPANRDQMAFVRDDNRLCVWVRGTAVPAVVGLTDGAATVVPVGDSNIAWSPDGAQIAFSGSTSGGPPEIWSAAVDLTAFPTPTFVCTKVSAVDGRGDYNPVWQPPPALPRLAYDNATGVFTRDLALGAETQLTNAAGDRLPAWSSGGDQVYFFRTGGTPSLCRVPSGGGATVSLVRATPPVGHDVPPACMRFH